MIATDCNGVPSTLVPQITESVTRVPTQGAYGDEKFLSLPNSDRRPTPEKAFIDGAI